jgi:hypothetical protein
MNTIQSLSLQNFSYFNFKIWNFFFLIRHLFLLINIFYGVVYLKTSLIYETVYRRLINPELSLGKGSN